MPHPPNKGPDQLLPQPSRSGNGSMPRNPYYKRGAALSSGSYAALTCSSPMRGEAASRLERTRTDRTAVQLWSLGRR
jgi:hypothetical protein